jgi:hypothetical protein
MSSFPPPQPHSHTLNARSRRREEGGGGRGGRGVAPSYRKQKLNFFTSVTFSPNASNLVAGMVEILQDENTLIDLKRALIEP